MNSEENISETTPLLSSNGSRTIYQSIGRNARSISFESGDEEYEGLTPEATIDAMYSKQEPTDIEQINIPSPRTAADADKRKSWLLGLLLAVMAGISFTSGSQRTR